MFYDLSKRLDVLLSPLAWALLLGALALYLARRRPRAACYVGGAALAVLYVCSTALLARPLVGLVELHDGTPASPSAHYDAVLLLGGLAMVAPDGRVEFSDSVDRLFAALELYRAGRASRIVVLAGGPPGRTMEADLIASVLFRLGVPHEAVVLDRASRNTQENALEAQKIVAREGFLRLVLVTSAMHMQRALGCFRAVGLAPDVLVTDHTRPAYQSLLEGLLPRASMLGKVEEATRELLGRVVYRLRGYSA